MLIEFLPSFFIFSQPVPVPSLSQLYCPPRQSSHVVGSGEIVIENIFKRSDGQTASRLIFDFAPLHRIYRNHGYIGRNTAGAVQGEGRADVQHRRGQGACRLCVGVGRYPGYLAVLLSLSTDPGHAACFENFGQGSYRMRPAGRERRAESSLPCHPLSQVISLL